MILKYTSSVISRLRALSIWSISPNAKSAPISERIWSTRTSSVRTAHDSAPLTKKSPTSTATWLFHTLLMVALPRLEVLWSITSSWISEALWSNSIAAPPWSTFSLMPPNSLPLSNTNTGRICFPFVLKYSLTMVLVSALSLCSVRAIIALSWANSGLMDSRMCSSFCIWMQKY